MNKKLFRLQETGGFVATVILTLFLWSVYHLTGRTLPGALFGAVNLSIWEQVKPMLLGYILYGLAEITTSRPFFRQFIVAKFVGLYSILLLYITQRSLLLNEFDGKINILIAVLSLLVGYLLSYKLTVCDYPLSHLYPTACFMILILFILSFTFTAFPPKGLLFIDPVTNLYGIVPDYIDVGAIILNNMYF